MALILHAHPLSSYCWKVLIALYENETPFTLRELNFGDPDAVAAFAALWPIAKMPVLVDRDRTIAESSIIIEHLDMHHRGATRLIPHHADPDAALKARMMDRVFDDYVMTPVQTIVGNRIRPADVRDQHGVSEAHELLTRALGWLESELAGRSWAGGEEFSLADCAAMPALHYTDKVHPFRGDHPILAAYLERLEARSRVARVLAEAKPYAHMFPQG